MTFGTTLRLPGEYFNEEETPTQPQIFLDRLRQYMQDVKSKPTAHHCRIKPFIHRMLHSSTHVFVRVDSTRRPFDQPYEGPFKILNRNSDSVFRIMFKGQPADISTDRLKPAFLENIPEDNPNPMNPTEEQHIPESTLKTYPGPRSKRTITFAR
ncbi:uncharacterized protein LOC143902919 [Temnothorax americanus]|uniref:uncharacterized protein LOC143902919 n=1 Tax=Temnothorax americanus TaxID=1964332 RepID=UPI0040693622